MARTGAYWKTSIRESSARVHAVVREKVRVRALNVFDFCVANSPLDTGSYRASWRFSEGAPDYYWAGRFPRGMGVIAPPPRPPEKASTKFYRKFFISNGSPYAKALEYGWSEQAPDGVVRMAMIYA